MREIEIRRRGWRVECLRPVVNNPPAEFMARVFDGPGPESQLIGFGGPERAMDAAVEDAYRSACEAVQVSPVS